MTKQYIMITCSCIIIILVIIVVLSLLTKDYIFCEEFWRKKHDTLHTELISLLTYVDGVFYKNNVDYFICSGTLLGSIRHGNIIPWDDDMDIGVKCEDMTDFEHKVKLIKDIFKDDDVIEVEFDKTCSAYLLKLYNKHDRGIFVDVFFLKRQQSGKYQMISQNLKGTAYSEEWYNKDQLTNLSQCTLDNKVFPCPSNSMKSLKNTYGDYSVKRLTHLHNVSIPLKIMVFINNIFGNNRVN